MRHLLLTNDFPPKVGGIQSYLWELWRRLPPEDVTVVTAAQPDAGAFDAEQPFRTERLDRRVLLPTPALLRDVRALIRKHEAAAVVIDPAFPLGSIGPSLPVPYAVVVHGAEVTVPGRLPAARRLLARTVREASLVIAAGRFAERQARNAVPDGLGFPRSVVVPPTVDIQRFRPLDAAARVGVRARLGLPVGSRLVASVSRLVPRKGMDALIDAAARLAPGRPDLLVAIAGHGRDGPRLARRIVRTGAPVRLLGSLESTDLPALYAAADVFALCCRNRWGGLEQEGFGTIFLEAAAAGLASVAGRSGGSSEAVIHGRTGLVVPDPANDGAVAAALAALLDDPELARRQGRAARRRVEEEFCSDLLSRRLERALDDLTSRAEAPRRRDEPLGSAGAWHDERREA